MTDFIDLNQKTTFLCDDEDLISRENMGTGWIYLLTNPSFQPDLCKIGVTSSLEARLKDLNSPTSVPTPFTLVHSWFVYNAKEVERQIHHLLRDYRISSSREFFKIDPSEAIYIIENDLLLCEEKREIGASLVELKPDSNQLADLLRALIVKSGKTIEMFSRENGVSRRSMYYYLSGKVDMPSTTLLRLLKSLGHQSWVQVADSD